MRPLIFLAVGLLCATACSSTIRSGVLVVSSPELKKSAGQQQEDLKKLTSEWQATKKLLADLTEEQFREALEIQKEVSLWQAEARVTELLISSGQPGEFTKEAVTALVNAIQIGSSPLKATKLLEDLKGGWPEAEEVREKRIMGAWSAVLSSMSLSQQALPHSWQAPWNLGDLNLVVGLIDGKIRRKELLEGDDFYLFRLLLELSEKDSGLPELSQELEILAKERDLVQSLNQLDKENWAEVDTRLRLVNTIASYHNLYLANDIEAVDWEKLARAIGEVAEAAEDFQR